MVLTAPALLARELMDRGEIGTRRYDPALNFTDFLYRSGARNWTPARGGAWFTVRQPIRSMSFGCLAAACSQGSRRGAQWDAARPTEGAYSALLFTFADGLRQP